MIQEKIPFPEQKTFFQLLPVADNNPSTINLFIIHSCPDLYLHCRIAGEQLTGQEMAQAMSKALGKEIHYNSVSPETFRSYGFPGADDLGNMFQFYRDFDEVCNSVRDVAFSKELNPQLKSFDMWLAENTKRIPLE